MGGHQFALGPLSADATTYVSRDADRQTVAHLERLDYVQITDPRQQGKTSLLVRLKQRLPGAYRVVYVDIESLRSDVESAWYEDLASRLASQLEDVVDVASAPRATDCSTFRAFLSHLVRAQRGAARPIVIALDEVGSLTMPWAEGFFRVLREVYTVREFETPFKRLGFVLAGAFDPGTLIKDAAISPFNVAHWVRLEDFSLPELVTMAEQLTVREPDTTAFGIHQWTDGQPYLAHNLCLRLGRPHADEAPPDVREAVQWLLQNDTHHLRSLRRRLETQPDLAEYAARALSGGIKLSPSVNPRHFELAHVVGIVKADDRGLFRVRNRMYAEGLGDAFLPVAAKVEPRTAGKSPVGGEELVRWAGGKDVILAIVFTDIVGSTAMGNEHGDERMEEIRRPHFARLQESVTAHGGRKIKELGDGVMAVFKTTDAALDFALDVWHDTGHALVHMRAGIHTGTVAIHEGDTFGNAVNFAARVSGAALGPEIYLSERAKEDIDSKKAARHAKMAWRCCGDLLLKGFPGQHRLWALIAPGSDPES